MNRLPTGYSFFLMMIVAASMPLHAANGVELTQAMIADKYYERGMCVTYLRDVNPALSRIIMEDAKLLAQEDVIRYVAGSKSLIGDLLEDAHMQSLPDSIKIKETRERLKGKRDFEATFTGVGYSQKDLMPAQQRFNKMFEPSSQLSDSNATENYFKYFSCNIAETLNKSTALTSTYEEYENHVLSHIESAKIGYFEVDASNTRVAQKVGTGNPYAEPRTSPESRFFIIDASFRNIDTESRLPSEGSLFVKYKGKEYKYDMPEPIMLEGYNIWFRSINPLITMRTKIVYRIPNEIEGEVFWQPGRNSDNVRLWVGNVRSVK